MIQETKVDADRIYSLQRAEQYWVGQGSAWGGLHSFVIGRGLSPCDDEARLSLLRVLENVLWLIPKRVGLIALLERGN